MKLTEQIEEARNVLADLTNEQAVLPSRLHAAVEAADAQMMAEIQDRIDRIPNEIRAQKIRIERLQIDLDEQKLPAAQAAMREALLCVEPAREAVKAAQRDLDVAISDWRGKEDTARDLRMSIEERKRRVAAMLAEVRPQGVPVRSVWQNRPESSAA